MCLLQTLKNLIVCILKTDENYRNTITSIEIAVLHRQKLNGYIYVRDNKYSDTDGRLDAFGRKLNIEAQYFNYKVRYLI